MPFDPAQPQVAAAMVAGIVGLVIGIVTVAINAAVTARVASQKVRADREQALIEKAWADYELRRDLYTAFAGQVDCLFEGGDASGRSELNRMARRIRLVGSDRVVRALNEFFEGIQNNLGPVIGEQRFRALFNAMRQDIRQLHAMPPHGTDLDEGAFPIQGSGP